MLGLRKTVCAYGVERPCRAVNDVLSHPLEQRWSGLSEKRLKKSPRSHIRTDHSQGNQFVDPSSSFWITPRSHLLSVENNLHMQRAQLTYKILHNGPSLLLDSDLINNLHLRDAILQEDRYILGLIESGLLQFAVREVNRVTIPLATSAQSILKVRGNVPIVPVERFDASAEFDFVERHASLVQWSLESAKNRYGPEVIRILTETLFDPKDLPDLYRIAILEFVEHRAAEGQPISWGLFYNLQDTDLWSYMSQRFPGKAVRRRYGNFIFQALRGPYASFIPDSLGMSATYTTEDRLGLDIARGRYNANVEDLQKITLARARIGLSDFVEGLARLDVKDVIQLRSSEEFGAYERACMNFSASHGQITDVLKAYHSYRRRIDHSILDLLGHHRPIEKSSDTYSALKILGNRKHWVRFALDLARDMIPTFGIPTVLEFGWNRLQEFKGTDAMSKKVRQAVAERAKLDEHREIEKELLITQMQMDHQPTFDGKLLLGTKTNELCTSVN